MKGTTQDFASVWQRFSDHIYSLSMKKMVDNFGNYQNKLQNVQSQKLSGMEIRKLYEKSKELDLPSDTSYLLKLGMESELKGYFLTERFRFLAEEEERFLDRCRLPERQICGPQ